MPQIRRTYPRTGTRTGRQPRARTAVAVVGAALALFLAGCSTGPTTIAPTDFSSQIADLLAKQVGNGVTPTITCPDKPIPIVDGTVVHCDLTTADSPGVVYDTTTTISNAHGADFHIDTKVASEPK